ncbi:procathepsin L-like [Oppia nitens]|uniref:procathepsin L-like n=1 Tax=Oppia nitens TaxID=1686743 RepID=UPI0023DA9CE1|nr:procathepsin L-like [Oppia nitens]
MFAIVLAFLLISGAIAVPVPQQEIESQWKLFKQQFRSGSDLYTTEEDEAYRRTIFEDTYRQIVRHNNEADQGLHTYWMGINQFSDLTTKEWERQWLSSIITSNVSSESIEFNGDLPSSVDWRNKGLVAPIKNQGQCGSCWAFAAVAAVEGQYAKKHGHIQTLSEQNIVDCNHQTDCQRGGNSEMAYNTITREGGIESEQDYPYTSGRTQRVGTCRFQRALSKANIQRFSSTSGETGIQQAVANVGPITVYIDASGNGFRNYRSGVYSGPCSSTQLNHAVTAIGYGTEGSQPYYIIRNSWDTTWGDRGYVKIYRGRNTCGVATEGTWPLGVN